MKASTDWKLAESAWTGMADPKDIRIRELAEEMGKLQAELQKEKLKQERWAQQLHDALNQSLFSAGLIAEVLPRLMERDPEAARRSLEDLRRLTFGAMAEMRVLLVESHPDALSNSELKNLVRLLGNVTAGRLNIPVQVGWRGTWKLPPEVQGSLYTFCKEILSVIIHRARVKQVTIQVSQNRKSTIIHIHLEGDRFEIGQEKVERIDDLLNAALGAERFGIMIDVKNKANPSSEVILRWQNSAEKEPGG